MTRAGIVLIWLTGVLSLAGSESLRQDPLAGVTPLQWSIRMADAEIDRLGDRLVWTENGKAKWDYTAGLFTLSLLKLNEALPNPRYVKFAESTIRSFITSNGTIRLYKPEEYQLDHINPGKTVLALYRLTGEERYKKAADLLRTQFDTQPRTSDGGFWHKQRYPHQMWLDGLYMGAPFYAEYVKLYGGPDSAWEDIAKQFRLVAAHTYDPATRLYYHGWDESKEQDWANKVTGTSSNFWGRAIGWYGMGLVDVLDFFPTNHPGRQEIIGLLQKLCAGIVKYQDPETGLWYQVMDQGGRKGNYLEATASTMFIYTMAKGMNRGYLARNFEAVTLKGYRGILSRLIKNDEQNRISLTQCCSVAGLGYGRDGSYEYYLKEPIVDDDLKGVGPFILGGLEVQRLLALPMTMPKSAGKVGAASESSSGAARK